MPSLTEVRDAARDLLAAGIPEAARVEAFAGELDMTSIARKNVGHSDAGSLFVAVGEAENAAAPGSLDFDMAAVFVVFAVARHASRPAHAEAAALALAQKAAVLIHGAGFGLAGLSPARVLSIAPVTDESLERNSFSIWSVTWEQRIIMEAKA